MDEISLIKRCQQGDLDAFGILVEHYTTKALRIAYLITGRRDIAEDVVQETLFSAIVKSKVCVTQKHFQLGFTAFCPD